MSQSHLTVAILSLIAYVSLPACIALAYTRIPSSSDCSFLPTLPPRSPCWLWLQKNGNEKSGSSFTHFPSWDYSPGPDTKSTSSRSAISLTKSKRAAKLGTPILFSRSTFAGLSLTANHHPARHHSPRPHHHDPPLSLPDSHHDTRVLCPLVAAGGFPRQGKPIMANHEGHCPGGLLWRKNDSSCLLLHRRRDKLHRAQAGVLRSE